MDSSRYKDFTNSRGLTYHYYFSPANEAKPSLLFCHGFPSTSFDWHKQVSFFEPLGYGILAVDELGLGGSSKPRDPEAFRKKLVAQDLLEILDAEHLEEVIAIGHDWGSLCVSSLATRHQTRCKAYAFLTVPYVPPSPTFDFESLLKQTKALLGYELYGYWRFFSSPEAPDIIEKNISSFMTGLHPDDPELWKTNFAPEGALQAWISSGKTCPRPAYMTEEEMKIKTDAYVQGDIASSLNWYKVMMSGLNATDDQEIPREQNVINRPVFFAACTKDYVCLAEPGKQSTLRFCPNATIHDYDADHWVLLSHSEQLNPDLLKWIEGVEKA